MFTFSGRVRAHLEISTLLVMTCAGASAKAQGLLQFQVSPALQESWSTSINAQPGDSVDVRLVISYTGSGTPIGFSDVNLQPTISNWASELGDTMLPLVNGGVGGQTSTPIGAVADAPGQYGRIIPFGVTNYSSTNFLRGHVNTQAGIEYLRLATSHVTSWFGDFGNANSGAQGVIIRQLNNTGRIFSDPPFDGRTQNIVVFKFGITLSATDLAPRTMTVDAPDEGIWANVHLTNQHVVQWWGDMDEFPPSFSGPPTVSTATINVVPGPTSAGLYALCGLLAGRRRNRQRYLLP